MNSYINNIFLEKCSSFQVYVFRYIFGILSIVFSLNCLNQFTFLVNESNSHYLFIKISLLIWLIVASLFTIGFSNFLIRIILFICSTYCLLSFDSCWNIEPKFYVTSTFFLVFIKVDKICFWNFQNTSTEAWPIKLLFLSQLLNFFTGGGFTKLFDTVWFNGYGAYYCLMVPWVKTDSITQILNYESFLILINYIILLAELFAFILFFIRKTRFLAFIIYFSFGLFTTFIFRIDLIGPLSLSLSLLFSSLFNLRLLKRNMIISDIDNTFLYKFSFILFNLNNFFNFLYFRNLRYTLFIILNIFIVYSFSTSLIYNLYRQIDLFKALPRVDLTLEEFEDFSGFNFLRELTCIRPDCLFTREHFENLTAFKIDVIGKDGTVENPIIVFNDDLSAGPDTVNFLSSRYYSAFMYECHYFRNIIWNWFDESKIEVPKQVFSMVKHVREKTTIPPDQIACIRLYIKHITQPEHFNGNVKLWLNNPWLNVIEFNNSLHPTILINESIKEIYPAPQLLLKDSLNLNDIIARFRIYFGSII